MASLSINSLSQLEELNINNSTNYKLVIAYDISASTGGPNSRITLEMISQAIIITQNIKGRGSEDDFLDSMTETTDLISIITFGGGSGTQEFVCDKEKVGELLMCISDSSYNAKQIINPMGNQAITFSTEGYRGATGATFTHLALEKIINSNNFNSQENIRLVIITDGETHSRVYELNSNLQKIRNKFNKVKIEIISVVNNYNQNEERQVGLDLFERINNENMSSFQVSTVDNKSFELHTGDTDGSRLNLFGFVIIIPETIQERRDYSNRVLEILRNCQKEELSSFTSQQIKNYLENFYQLMKRLPKVEYMAKLIHFLSLIMDKKGSQFSVKKIKTTIQKIFEREWSKINGIRIVRGQTVRREIFSKISNEFNTKGISPFLRKAEDEECIIFDTNKKVCYFSRLTDDLLSKFNENNYLIDDRFMIFPTPCCPAMANEDFYRMLIRRFVANFLAKNGCGQENLLQKSILCVKFVINLATGVLKTDFNSPCKTLFQLIVQIMLNKEQVSRGRTSESALTLIENGQGLPSEHTNSGIFVEDVLFVLGLENNIKPSNIPEIQSFDVAPYIDGITLDTFYEAGYELSGVFYTPDSYQSIRNSNLRCHLGNLYYENTFTEVPKKLKFDEVCNNDFPDFNLKELIGEFKKESKYNYKTMKSDSKTRAIVFKGSLSSGKSNAIGYLLDLFIKNGYKIITSLDIFNNSKVPSGKLVFHLSFDMVSFRNGYFDRSCMRKVGKQSETFISQYEPEYVIADICHTGGPVMGIENIIYVPYMTDYSKEPECYSQFCAYNAFTRPYGFKSTDPQWFKVFAQKSGIANSIVHRVSNQNKSEWEEGHSKWISLGNSYDEVKARVTLFSIESLGFNSNVDSLNNQLSNTSISTSDNTNINESIPGSEIAEILIKIAKGEIDIDNSEYKSIPSDRDLGSGRWKKVRKYIKQSFPNINFNSTDKCKEEYIDLIKNQL